MRRIVLLLVAAVVLAAGCADEPRVDDLLASADGSTGLPDDTGTPPPPTTEPVPLEFPPDGAPVADPTPLPVDDDIRIGVLDNGLTYLLRSNPTPGASVDLRLVVNAGSRQQPVGNDGSAHFLEHMLFNGTESFPGNELTRALQDLGIRFGADVNAFTSYDETVYLLGATTFEPNAVDTAFDVLAEWASRAVIDPDQVAAEVGVVRDELRQGRESVDGAIFTSFEEIYTRGTPYEGHLVIGDGPLVEATEAGTLRAFYDAWYRPDNMAVVAVGDLPLDELETAVVERFDTLTARLEPSPSHAPVEIELDSEPVADVVVHPDQGSDYLSIDIPLPVWDTGTVGGERLTLIENAVAQMLASRLGEAFQRGDLDVDEIPFLSTFQVNRGLRYYGTNLRAPDLNQGLDQFMAQLLLAADAGFTDDDVDRVKTVLLATLEDELATLGSTQDAVHADRLTSHFLTGSGIDDDAARIRRQQATVESFTAGELSDFWRWLLATSGPVMIVVGSDEASLPTGDALLETLAAAGPAEGGDSTVAIDQLIDRPDPVRAVDEQRRTTSDGEITEWRFENGVVVSHQQTPITEGNFSVVMESTGGWSALPDPDASIADAAVQAVTQSGVGPHDPATVSRYLESRQLTLQARIDEHREGFFGSSATSDAEDLFALAHLWMTEPRVDPLALRSTLRTAETTLDRAPSDIDLRAEVALTDLVTGGDPRYLPIIDQDEIDALDADVLVGVFEDRFVGADDLHVAVVGDIERDEALDLAGRYLGTLPTDEADSWVDLGATVPTTDVVAEVPLTDGTANGGIIRLDWVEGAPTADDDVAALALSSIVTDRITVTIREELGASYGGNASVIIDREGPGALISTLTVDGDPARLEEIRGAVENIVGSLAAAGPDEAEFTRARGVIETEFGFVNNGLFLTTNISRTRFPDADVLEPDNRFVVLERLTAQDVQELAARLYADPVSVEVAKVLP